jgi:hypothetical protein
MQAQADLPEFNLAHSTDIGAGRGSQGGGGGEKGGKAWVPVAVLD